MERNLLITLAFDGTAYHGWQVQANACSVQQTVQAAAARVFGGSPSVTGCSRTDTGVHAATYCCTVRTDARIPCERIVPALNFYLPHDISARACREMPLSFHPRYDCTGKQYIYRIWNAPVRSPFWMRYAYHKPHLLDEARLNRAARAFCGKHDFSAFCAAGSSVVDTVRCVKSASVTRQGSLVSFCVEADGFLYHMVRIMAGTLLEIAQNNGEPDAILSLLEAGDRSLAGATAPAHGLILNRVEYGGMTNGAEE